MDEYPNSDEEFELMYGDELQMINQEDEDLEAHTAGPPSRKSLNFSTPKNKSTSQTKTPKSDPKPCSSKAVLENSFDRDFTQLDNSDPNTKKRGIEDLFGDIDDLLQEEERKSVPKKIKTDKEKREADEKLIQRILELRRQNAAKQNPSLSIVEKKVCSFEHIKNNVSGRVPKYPFIGVTRQDGDRIYVRMHNEEYEKESIERICKNSSYKGLLGAQSADLWEEANKLINQQIGATQSAQNSLNVEETNNSKLWVDLYKPRKYIELLSDESTNRTLLSWLILWDKVVFHRRPKILNIKQETNQNKFFQKKEIDLTLDETDRPVHKVALLCGSPGLGKTTLAHLVAKHWGYNVVEINASDDRNVESFKKALENATQMRSVIDREKRPNCLIFDEIDGAPSGAIDYLIKFINGTASKKGKNKKNILKRPVICICNDVYVPALRPLRQIALILNFPPTSSSRLAQRLLEISRYQSIKTDLGAMLALSEKTNNDIRSCLTVLNFFKTKNKPVTLSEIHKTQIGQKDMQKGLFNVWSDIFELKYAPGQNKDSNMSERMKNILDTVIAFGDYERLINGIFENYPNMKHKGTPFYPICDAMEWFGFTDLINQKIHETQNYTMGAYLPYGFVVWHFAFSSYQKKKIAYPSIGHEVTTKASRQTAIINEILRGMPPSLRVYISSDSLRLDIIPMFADILVPTLRTINVSLYAPEEKTQIANVVDIMIDYNLTYVQERNAEGSYVFYMDPNIEEVFTYNGLRNYRKTLSYTSKQMLSREIELEKMRKLEKSMHKNSEKIQVKQVKQDKSKDVNKVVPNHLQRLKPKAVMPKEVIVKDFFGRSVVRPAQPKFGDCSDQSFAGDIWFQFKEGYSNAVRRRIDMKTLLSNN